jgi:Protein of unknown function (DUF4031)
MSVYVDDMRMLATVGRLRGKWSHLTADSEEELLAFGALIAMRPEWLQHPGTYQFHFDVMDSKRERAITLGAIPITAYELVEKCMARRT